MGESDLQTKLQTLVDEHRRLDGEIAALADARSDALQLARLKKRKLALKDEIAALHNLLLPDIIA